MAPSSGSESLAVDGVALAALREVGVGWVRQAGDLIRSRFRTPFSGHRKADHSLVTEVDLAASALLSGAIAAHCPDHAVMSEEDGTHGPPLPGQPLWVIDPLDGTRNFAHGCPGFCTTVALMVDGVPLLGIVHDPLTGTTIDAVRGAGWRWDGRPRVACPPRMGDRLVAVPFGSHGGLAATAVEGLTARAVLRNVGSTCLHLAWVAVGALDGAVACQAKLWDVAAAACLLHAAEVPCVDGTGRALVPFDAAALAGADLTVVAGTDLLPDLLRLVARA